MPGAYLYGWDSANSTWVKCLVNAEGKLIIDPSEIFENTPTDNEHGKAPDSDWAYDHNAKADAHHAKYTDAEAQGAINADADHGSTASHNYFSGDHADLSNVTANQHHAKYTDAEAMAAIEAGSVHGVQLANHERGDYDIDGFLYWDRSEGIYIKSSVAPNPKTGGCLAWTEANVSAGSGIGISYNSSGRPTISTIGVPGSVPPGSKMLFKQNSAPSGWTFVSEDNDRVILNTSTESQGGDTGGSWTISGLGGTVAGHTLSVAEMPSHNHTIRQSSAEGDYANTVTEGESSTEYAQDNVTYYTGGSGGHSHGFTASHNGLWRPSYAKVITCSKD